MKSSLIIFFLFISFNSFSQIIHQYDLSSYGESIKRIEAFAMEFKKEFPTNLSYDVKGDRVKFFSNGNIYAEVISLPKDYALIVYTGKEETVYKLKVYNTYAQILKEEN